VVVEMRLSKVKLCNARPGDLRDSVNFESRMSNFLIWAPHPQGANLRDTINLESKNPRLSV